MNILIPHSWLADRLRTTATPEQFATQMSLTSVSIERIEKIGDDSVFDIEVTTNRPDLMSIDGIAREASAVLPQAGFSASYLPHHLPKPSKTVEKNDSLTIMYNNSLVNRIMAVVIDVNLHDTPDLIRERLEKTGIRSINNIVDVTNYIMREVGHPTHAFDYDKLETHTLHIRESKRGERLKTLDGKTYELPGGDIIADNGKGEIVDLLGIMGAENIAITPDTKRIVLFINNTNRHRIRKTSMSLGIRSEAAVLNEKGIDPELTLPTLLRGIELYKEIADGRVVGEIIDIYPDPIKVKKVSITKEKIDEVIGVEIKDAVVKDILTNLGFTVNQKGSNFDITIPSTRVDDVDIPEDIIEEVARVYGYSKIPNILPMLSHQAYYHQDENEFFWITKLKEAFRFWGFNEIYTYSMVSEAHFEGPIDKAVGLKNPLTEDHAFLRNTITPSMLEVVRLNKNRESLKLFEIANVYIKQSKGLPQEVLHLASIIKHQEVTFYEIKGVVEQVFTVLGISEYGFKKRTDGMEGALITFNEAAIGNIEMDEETASFEIDIQELVKSATSHKKYNEPTKFPPAIEDVRIEVSPHYTFKEISDVISSQDERVRDVQLLDVYESKKTFRIIFLDRTQNLTAEEITPMREKIYKALEKEFKAKIG